MGIQEKILAGVHDAKFRYLRRKAASDVEIIILLSHEDYFTLRSQIEKLSIMVEVDS